MAFGFYSAISINSAQVPSTQTDFPVLVNTTDARFKDVSHSGHVQSSSGFDIRPYTDSTLTTAITGYELERYNASTGEVVMWVKVSSLTSSSTPFVLAYGNAALTTDGSSTTTWSNGFKAVYHLKDGTTLSLSDSTSNAFTLGNTNTVTAAAGKIDGAASFVSASNQQLSYTATSADPGAACTFSGWVNATAFSNSYNLTFGTEGGIAYRTLYVKSTGKIACNVLTGTSTNVGYDGTGAATLSTSTPYYLTFSYDGTSGLAVFVNAVSDKTVAASGTLAATGNIYLGKENQNSTFRWSGTLDEVRIATVVRSSNWIATEYNNQVAPGTFYALGTENGIAGATNSNFLMFM